MHHHLVGPDVTQYYIILCRILTRRVNLQEAATIDQP